MRKVKMYRVITGVSLGFCYLEKGYYDNINYRSRLNYYPVLQSFPEFLITVPNAVV